MHPAGVAGQRKLASRARRSSNSTPAGRRHDGAEDPRLPPGAAASLVADDLDAVVDSGRRGSSSCGTWSRREAARACSRWRRRCPSRSRPAWAACQSGPEEAFGSRSSLWRPQRRLCRIGPAEGLVRVGASPPVSGWARSTPSKPSSRLGRRSQLGRRCVVASPRRLRLPQPASPGRTSAGFRASARSSSLDARLPGPVAAQGALIELRVRVRAPRPAEDGFDERLAGSAAGSMRCCGRRGLAGRRCGRVVARARRPTPRSPRARSRRASSASAGGHRGHRARRGRRYRRGLHREFRASGLYHLLAVSGPERALHRARPRRPRWLLGVAGRWARIVDRDRRPTSWPSGWQPSVVRGVELGVLAVVWLVSRPRDCLARARRSARSCCSPGRPRRCSSLAFSSRSRRSRRSFVAPLGACLAGGLPRSGRAEGRPRDLDGLRLATAPIAWLHFGSVPLYAVRRTRSRGRWRRRSSSSASLPPRRAVAPVGCARVRLARRTVGWRATSLVRARIRGSAVRAGRLRCGRSRFSPRSRGARCARPAVQAQRLLAIAAAGALAAPGGRLRGGRAAPLPARHGSAPVSWTSAGATRLLSRYQRA